MPATRNPNRIPGPAVGAETMDDKIHEQIESVGQKRNGTDNIVSAKFRSASRDIKYIMDGLLSADRRLGKFVFTIGTDKPKVGSFIINEDQKVTSIVNSELRIGSTDVKSLTGLLLNPAGITTPSSALTPLKSWVGAIFPVLIENDFSTIAILKAAQPLLFSALAGLTKKSESSTTTTNSRQDLGTIIQDNAEFESAILSGIEPI